MASPEGSVLAMRAIQPGLLQTLGNIVRTEGVRYVIIISHFTKIMVGKVHIFENVMNRN